MNSGIERPRYKPSGRVDGKKLIPALALLLIISAGIAGFLYGSLAIVEGYCPILTVFMALTVSTYYFWKVVKNCHCRNQILAGILGTTYGLMGYFGFFHFDQCGRWQVPWTALDRLPGYIIFRNETDQMEWMGKAWIQRPLKPAAGVQPVRPLANANLQTWIWGLFFFEASLWAVVPFVFGVAAARQPYSEKHRRWCYQELLLLEPAAAQTLRQALATATVGAWINTKPRKAQVGEAHGSISVWYTPASPDMEPDLQVFMALGWGQPLRLFPEEAAAFSQLLPALLEVGSPVVIQLASEAEQINDPGSARIWPVPPPYAGCYQNAWNLLLENSLFYGLWTIPPLLTFGLLVGGTYILAFVMQPPMMEVVYGYVVGVGLLVLFFLRWWLNPDDYMPDVLTRKFVFRLLCRAVSYRPDALVAVEDPRVVLAKMYPRRLWLAHSEKSEEKNTGLLVVDNNQQGIWFEGDLHRYWIPRSAILACSLENMTPLDANVAVPYAVVLQVRLGSGTWEFPFVPLANIEGANNWERAVALRGRIEAMCGRSLEQPH